MQQDLITRFVDSVYGPLIGNHIYQAFILIGFAVMFALLTWHGHEELERGADPFDVILDDTYAVRADPP